MSDWRKDSKNAIAVLTWVCVGCMLINAVTGCRAKRSMETRRDSVADVCTVKGIDISRKWYERAKNDSATVNDVWHITIYDTKTDADSSTGMRPVLAEIERTKTTARTERTEERANDETVSGTSAENVRVETISAETSKVTELVKPMPKWRLYMLVAVVVICTMMALFGKGLIQEGFYWLINKIFG